MATLAQQRDTETDSGYENKARRIAREIGLTMRAEHMSDRCPPWEGDSRHVHGDRYRITLHKDGRSLSFDFWNSQHDMERGIDPGYYDVLSSVGSDAQSPTDPDEVAREYGDMRPSQAIAVARFAERLQRFFTESELEKLAEIQ